MNIALIRKEFKAAQGGAERYAVNLARGLSSTGHKVHVYAGRYNDGPQDEITIHRVPYITAPSLLKNLSFQRSVQRLLRENDYDIVHGLSQVYPQDVYRLGDGLHCHWLRIQTPHPGKRLLHYLSPRHQVILHIERNIFKKGNYRIIIANSDLCRKQAVRYYGVPEERLRLVYNGINPERFQRAEKQKVRSATRQHFGIGARDFVLLFAGNNFKRKGLQFVIQCVTGLKKRGLNVKLLVAGRGKAGFFTRVVKSSGLADDVFFLGLVENIDDIYCASDVLVHPSLYDPFSNVCLEAMGWGLPVVTTRSNGASEIIENGISGIVIDYPWETEKMVSEISRLIENDGMGLNEMGEHAARVAQNYPVEKNIRETVNIYEEILRYKKMS